jgi:TnpA family transposase
VDPASYIRADTITTANNRLVDVHAALPMTKALGGGEPASADGIRFVVPVRSVHAGANPKYFGRRKGVTYMNYTSAGSIGFFGFVVPGTLRDSMVILDGLLEQHTSLRPTTLVTDSASYTVIWTFSGECCPELLCSVRLEAGIPLRLWSSGLDRLAEFGQKLLNATHRAAMPLNLATPSTVRCVLDQFELTGAAGA